MLFHEIGVVSPILAIAYDLAFSQTNTLKTIARKAYYLIVLSPLLPYAVLRYSANSHWLSGDYSYNLFKLPFNFIGNILGYFMLAAAGPATLPLYEKLRDLLRLNLPAAIIGSVLLIGIFVFLYRTVFRKLELSEKKIVAFSILFFVVSLLPFLGLGNIASRYIHLASFGFSILFIIFAKKFYNYLSNSGAVISGSILAIAMIIFGSLHLFQLQEINSDWKNASRKTQSVLTTLGYVYAHYTAEDLSALYFVDLPTRHGQAWVFPVGLDDAVWLVFKDKNINVHQVGTVEEAFGILGDSTAGRVFKFDDNGKLTEYIKETTGKITPEGK